MSHRAVFCEAVSRVTVSQLASSGYFTINLSSVNDVFRCGNPSVICHLFTQNVIVRCWIEFLRLSHNNRKYRWKTIFLIKNASWRFGMWNMFWWCLDHVAGFVSGVHWKAIAVLVGRTVERATSRTSKRGVLQHQV